MGDHRVAAMNDSTLPESRPEFIIAKLTPEQRTCLERCPPIVGRGDGTSANLLTQLLERWHKHEEAGRQLEKTPAGRFVLKPARQMWDVFFKECIYKAVSQGELNRDRWFLRRVGAQTAW
jgi:hypothetical protein